MRPVTLPTMLLSLALVAIGCAPAAAPVSTAPSSTVADATPVLTLSPSPTLAPASPLSSSPDPVAVLPGEKWLVYQRWTHATGARLRLVRPDGSDDHPLLPDVTAEQLHPDWSPDGTKVAFVVANDPNVFGGQIWVADADGGNARKLTDCSSPCVLSDSPAWAPDGRAIAFVTADAVGELAPSASVKTVDPSDGALRTLLTTKGPEYPFSPRWAPDGRSLVVELDRFASTRVDDGTPLGSAIAVVDLRATSPQPRILTAWSMFGAYPDWSPAGDRIVFSTYDLGVRDAGGFKDPSSPSDLYTITPGGRALTRVTQNPSSKALIRNGTASGPLSSQPTWTPDGEAIVFVQVTGESWPGWTMATVHPDGAGLAPAVGSQFMLGTHPRFRPTP